MHRNGALGLLLTGSGESSGLLSSVVGLSGNGGGDLLDLLLTGSDVAVELEVRNSV